MTSASDKTMLPDAVRPHLGLQRALFNADGLSDGANQPFETVLAGLDLALRVRPDAEAHAFRCQCLDPRRSLLAGASGLVREIATAADLVPETLLHAWRHRGQFKAGTNLEACEFTILRNREFH
ncbi:hypothetical protein [Methylobacterium sp. UNC378MF]|uniref:hypothetical protein n=1 Tax=Methylobacterium sp. UNC378MF TaxID=1502748 RepID=UPI0011136329|nr:hypothetical protein [Methylobacterium sp. UNC378MF]